MTRAAKLEPVRMEAPGELCFAGITRRYAYADRSGIAPQWAEFNSIMAGVTDRVGGAAYAVVGGFDPIGFDYHCAVEVARDAPLDPGLTRLVVPPLSWAVFPHAGHVASLGETCAAAGAGISGKRAAWGGFIERYGPEFDPATGHGGIEIWLPVGPAA